MISKQDLIQYSDLKKEVVEVRSKIKKLEQDILKIESGETVIDSVTGGNGGCQHFKKTLLYSRKTTLQLLEDDLLDKTNEIEEFIASINDSRIRRIINLRFLENKSWNEVADCIGGGNTEDSVRKSFTRFFEK